MNRRLHPLYLLLASSLALGCDARGIWVGSEELCVADEALFTLRTSSTERVSTCARVGENQLNNAGFESPTSACEDGYCQFTVGALGGWETSSAAQVVEIWSDGHRGVAAPEGSQFVELNATSQDTLWQDVELAPQQLMYWSFLHRGRNGIESVALQVGPPDATSSQGIFTSSADYWTTYSGLYRSGPEETVTRFALVSLDGTTEGNLVDAVVFAPVD